MLRYTKILLILLIVGGCIYAEGSTKNGNVDSSSRHRILQNKEFKSRSNSQLLQRKSKEKHMGRSNVRPSNRDNLSNGNYTTFLVTAYTKNDAGMNGKGVTASGKVARVNHTIAASRGIPLHTKIYFPELGLILTVEDRGGRITHNRIDMYVSDRQKALKWGKRKLKGVVLK